MRVLHVISGLGTGGAESFLVALSARLKADGFDQEVVCVTGAGCNAEKLGAEGIPVHVLGVSGVASAGAAIAPLKSIVNRLRPDVVQGWMYHGDLFATLAHRLALSKPRLYWNIRCSDMRLEDYALQLRLAVKACAALSKRPDAVLANSRSGADVHSKAGYRPRQMIILPNGIDTDRFAPHAAVRAEVRRELGLAGDERLVIHVARVDPMKDHLTLLSALESLDNAVTLLVGKGTQSLVLPSHILALGERPDVARLLCAADVIVSSSAYGEGFSNAIAEGMSAGLVPVATDVGDVRDIIADRGEIVPVRDAARLAAAIRQVIELPNEALVTRGLSARQRIVENFSLQKAASRFAALYRGNGLPLG